LFITATLDEKNHVPQGGVYFGTVTSNKLDLKVVLGLLNSSLLSVIYKILFGGMHMGGGYLRYRTNFLEQLPVSDIPATESSIISDLVDRILAAKRRDSESETTVLEQEIDRLVYKLYDITLEEIKIVEDGT